MGSLHLPLVNEAIPHWSRSKVPPDLESHSFQLRQNPNPEAKPAWDHFIHQWQMKQSHAEAEAKVPPDLESHSFQLRQNPNLEAKLAWDCFIHQWQMK